VEKHKLLHLVGDLFELRITASPGQRLTGQCPSGKQSVFVVFEMIFI
jgi:hypothetical protein